MVYITNYISFILINIFFSLEKKIKVYYQRKYYQVWNAKCKKLYKKTMI